MKKSDKKASVTLRFKSENAKKNFMAQLSDGWGESHCELKWPHTDISFHECDDFDVDVFDEDEGVL